MEFIPVNKELAEQFEDSLNRNMLYRGTDNFMAIYNNNLINKNNSDIDETARKITEHYKNISLVNKKFIVKSKEEVISEEFEVLFPHISFVATLKRVAGDILRDNYPEDSLLVFTEKEQNVVQILTPDSDAPTQYDGSERLKNVNKSISTNPFLLGQVEVQAYGEDGIAFKAADILKIDTSFISDIGELLEAYVK